MSVDLAERSAPLQRITAEPGFNRWLIPPAALAIHLCIGQVYATSVYKTALVSHFDTSLTAVGVIFSIAIVVLGLSAALFGTWVDRNGPRRAMLVAAVCWATGFFVGAAGIYTSQLWLVYLGYGVIGGVGLGIGYISPVSTLMKWFPDRPGLATGMAIMGFGGGAMIAGPLSSALLNLYDTAPAGSATASGSAVGGLFLTLGAVYLAVMLFGAWLVRVPAPGWAPAGYDPSQAATRSLVTDGDVRANTAIRTPQFWLLWTLLFCNVTAGIGILEQASPMIRDFFRTDGSTAISAAAAAGFVGLLSLMNMLGRFVWSSTSDVVGRKVTYLIYLGGGVLLYTLLAAQGQVSVVLFVVLAGVIISFYGGGFATIPAYLRDLFGTLEVGAIHGRLLTAWSAAGVVGPLIINGFLDARGEPGDLVAADYRPALFTMVVLLVVGLLANLLVRAVHTRHHVDSAEQPTSTTPAGDAGGPTAPAVTPAGAPPVPVWLPWAIVGLPLVYGVLQTAGSALKLFS